MNIPSIDCKFCGQKLETSTKRINIASNTVNHMECTNCKASIRDPWRVTGFMSKHQVEYHPFAGVIYLERLILDDGIHIETRYAKNTTTLSEYRHGGPMECELFPIAVLPLINIKPTEPEFKQRLKVWLTFS